MTQSASGLWSAEPTPAPGPAGPGALGAFGPPDPAYGGASGAYGDTSAPGVGGAAGPEGKGPAGPAGPSAPSGTSGVPEVSALSADAGGPDSADRGSRVRSLALTAAGGQGRSRALSCTLVLTVAGVLAAATTAVVLFDVLPGGGGRKHESHADPAASPATRVPSAPTRTATSPPTEAETPSALPTAFLGTWTGDVKQQDGTPNGTITTVFTAGGTGDDVARTTYRVSVSSLSTACYATAELVSATATEVTLTERTDPDRDSGPLCTGATTKVTYTLRGGTLHFASQDAMGGRPTSEMRKAS
ncbi:hypothetical protein RKE29_18525 [Streptomyces sp. B1866]|uniref:hypothetical protein n=1 Tax=Streptomyces sp. B1866 TaxID=3075431 RepID=UPI00288C9FEB|nr:hypothetical protein [Streptomyces sp. B1866]MDT3398616.1 hypothetical protein [Streptomyces sp. B1866]